MKKRANVVGFGKSNYKMIGGKQHPIPCFVFLVEKKLPVSMLKTDDIIPATVDGLPTDVVEVGPQRALTTPEERQKAWRPAPGGVSVGHYAITAGTLGVLVNGLILSNNHVLADCNAGQIGDDILQPGAYDGGQSGQDTIAKLKNFVPLIWDGAEPPPDNGCKIFRSIAAFFNALAPDSRYELKMHIKAAENLVDCALAEPVDLSLVKSEVLDIGEIVGYVPLSEVTVGMPVKKSGRTTALNTGIVEYTGVTIQCGYGGDRIATFVNQIITSHLADGGDSGSLVVSEDNRAVGLLFGGSDQITIVSPIEYVMDALGITF